MCNATRTLTVAVVSETYPPEVNGVALTLARYVEGMRALGHRVSVVRPRQPADETGRGGDLLVRGLPLPRYPGLRFGLPAGRVLRAHWSRSRPDLVHVVTEGPLGWSAVHAAHKLGLPVTSDFRTHFDAYASHYGYAALAPVVDAYLRAFHARTQMTFVPTEALRACLAARGYGTLAVVPRGVDTTLFHPARRSDRLRARWGAGPETLVAAYVGRLAPEKNPGLLLAAYRAMRQRGDVRLVLVGDGPLRDDPRWGEAGIVRAGVREGVDLAAHYASADVFLFPSLTETFGNVVLEALASGLALVAFDEAAAHDCVTSGVNGYLVASHDPGRFVEQATALVANPHALSCVRPMARASIASRDWAQAVRRLEQAFLTAIRESRAPEPGVMTGA